MKTIKDEVYAILTAVPGMRQSRKQLAAMTGANDRAIRTAVSELRDEGVPICTDRKQGGYWLGTRSEYRKTAIADYTSRMRAYKTKIDAFYGITPIEGQVGLDV